MKCCKYPLSEIKNKIIALECEELKTITPNKSILKYFKIDENCSNFELTFYHQITLKSNNYVICCKNIKNQFFNLEKNDEIPDEPKHFCPVGISNYNIPFADTSDSDLTKLCLQRLQIMLIERNELGANIHFNHLMNANWSPVFGVCLKIINSINIIYLTNNYNNTFF